MSPVSPSTPLVPASRPDPASRPRILCLAGPTASGKTGAALHLARFLEALPQPRAVTVINADSRQIYEDFPLITAQPDPMERAVCPHVLYGYLPTGRKSTAWEWVALARQAVEEVIAQGRQPILVGGTGMYLKTLIDGMAAIPAIDPALSARLLEECRVLGAPALHARLAQVDPVSAARIHPNDRQRVVRALEVEAGTGTPLSWWHEHTPPGAPWDVLHLGVGLPLPELEPLLVSRIHLMLDKGALDEAQAALARCPDTTAPGWSGIGCAEVARHLRGELDLDACIALWAKNTRAYAKRQWTWFRADTRIRWYRPGQYEAMEHLVQQFLSSPDEALPGLLGAPEVG